MEAKLNPRQKLLTAEQKNALPPLYSTDGQVGKAIAVVKFFNPAGPQTWFATEYDAETGTFFGLAYNCTMADQMPDGELGYFAAAEICNCPVGFGLYIERDIHFRPKPLAEAFRELTGREYGPAAKPATEADCDCALCRYWEAEAPAATEAEAAAEEPAPFNGLW